jgi:DNA-binding HxlR family transcriptional regulator
MKDQRNPYTVIKKLFHEPKRLSIMSILCGSREGIAFNDLKNAGGFTDGNLNRHLKTLSEAGAVRIKKSFVGAKPRTTISITELGFQRFEVYLEALSNVLKDAKKSVESM